MILTVRVSHKVANILTVNRKSHHPIETLFHWNCFVSNKKKSKKVNKRSFFFSACTPAGEYINASSGHISSLYFPDNYEVNRVFTWNITVPSEKIIKLTFLNFTLVANENDDCAGAAPDSARVFITNVASHDGNPDDFKFCGQKLPHPVYSKGNSIQVRFESCNSTAVKGFNATFEAIDGNSRKSSSSMVVYEESKEAYWACTSFELSENFVEYIMQIMK